MAQVNNTVHIRQAQVNQQPNVAQAAQQQAPQQQINVGLLGANQPRPRGFQAVKAQVLDSVNAIKNQVVQIGRAIQAPLQSALNHIRPQGGWQNQEIQFNGQTIRYSASELKSMGFGNRTAFQANLGQTLLARITHGETLMKDILGGNPPQNGATHQEIGDIMLFLDAKSRMNGNTFAEGAYTIEDPTGALYDFLESSHDRYVRASSHMEDKQRDLIDNPGGVGAHANMHRGIDLQDGSTLPSEKSTVLFGAILQSDNPAAGRRIFLKAEGFGCRIAFGSAHRDIANTGGRPNRPKQFSDFTNFCGHAKDFIVTRFQNDLAGSRKERIPTPIKTQFKAMMDVTGSPILRQGNPTGTAQGVHVMLANTREYLEQNHHQLPAGGKDAFVSFMRSLVGSLKDTNSLNARIGNEVMFSSAEIQNDVQQVNPTNAQKMTAILETLNLTPANLATMGVTDNDLLRIAAA